jgi:uncharacterized protein (TIGR02270 family)
MTLAIETSSTEPPRLIPRLLRRHAEDAAFYWARRMQAARSSQHDLRSLGRFEFLLQANLEGLRVAQRHSAAAPGRVGAAGWQPTWARTQMWKTADEAFVSSVLALETAAAQAAEQPAAPPMLQELEELALVQHEQDANERLVAQGLTSAAAWLRWEQVAGTVQRWALSSQPLLRRAAIAACALQRIPAGAALAQWLDDPEPLVRTRALRAVGELARADLAGALLEVLKRDGASEAEQIEAAWSLCLVSAREPALGERAAAIGLRVLSSWSQPGSTIGNTRHLAVWALLAPTEQQHTAIEQALQDRALWRRCLQAMRLTGDAHWLPWLLELMAHETSPPRVQAFFQEPASNLARLAGDVFAHIAGLRIGEQLWASAPEPTDEEDIASDPSIPAARKQDPDDGLLWPDVMALKRWWAAHCTHFEPGQRYLAGQALNIGNALQRLADAQATQQQREHAALFLHVRTHTPMLFDVGAALPRQREQAAALGLVLKA